MITTAIQAEIVQRLAAITAGGTTPAGNAYAFTPTVVNGRRLLNTEGADGAVYSVQRGERIRNNRTPTGEQNEYAVEYIVAGVVPISDYDNPALDAEKCISDIAEALLEGDTVNERKRCTLGGLCEDFSFDSDTITQPDPDDVLISFSVTFAAILQGKRGYFYT